MKATKNSRKKKFVAELVVEGWPDYCYPDESVSYFGINDKRGRELVEVCARVARRYMPIPKRGEKIPIRLTIERLPLRPKKKAR